MGPDSFQIRIGDKRKVRVASFDPASGIYQMGADGERRWKRLIWFNDHDGIVYVTFKAPTDAFVQDNARWIELVRDGHCYRVSRPSFRKHGLIMRTARGQRWGIPWPWPEGRARENMTIDDYEQESLL